jgi:hypothetical protein
MMGKIVIGTYKIMMGKIVLGTYKNMMGTYKIMIGKILIGTYHTILKLADHARFKMVRYVFLRPQRPDLDGQDFA